MTIVKIISGTYGHRPENSPYVIPVTPRDPAISVDDDEAKRLVKIGVAAYVDAEAPLEDVATAVPGDSDGQTIGNSPDNGEGENGDSDPGEIAGTLDPEDLKGWKMEDLKKLAADLGIDTTGIKKKDDLIAAIAAVEVSIPDEAVVMGTGDVVE